MFRKTNLILTVLSLLVVSTLMATTNPNLSTTIQKMNQMPLAFTKNMGQWDDRVLFRANSSGATMWFTKEGVTYQFTRHIGRDTQLVSAALGVPDSSWANAVRPYDSDGGDSVEQLVLIAKFLGANANPEAFGEGQMEYKCNYFLGNDPSKWHTDVPNFEAVTLKDIYPGIDLKYSGDGSGQATYEFVAAPGADVALIKVAYEGVEETSLAADGRLILKTKWGEMIAAIKTPTSSVLSGTASFSQSFEKTIGFETYRSTRQALGTHSVGLVYSTYLGGGSEDLGEAIALDGSGNAYVTGYTGSSDFPTLSPYQSTYQGAVDVFVTKFSSSGNSLIYSTFLGGGNTDYVYGIAVDDSGNAYVTGGTWSSNFPTQNAYQTDQGGIDAFMTQLSSSGNSLIYSTYLGGGGDDWGNDLAVDSSGNAYVTGTTASTDFPTLNPYQMTNHGYWDVFVTKLSSTGNSLIYSTYLGGNNNDTYGAAWGGIAVDGSGNAYVTGFTQSTDFPTLNPFQTYQGGGDAFVTKLSSTGNSLIYSTHLGGTNTEYAYGIEVDGSGNAYVAGFTQSSDFPTLNPYQTYQGAGDAFVTKLSSFGNSLIYSTYLGGGSEDYGYGIAVDGSGNAFVTGRTHSTNFPTSNPFQSIHQGGAEDAFVAKLNSPGNSLSYSTYLGGGSEDYGYGIAVDGSGNAYVTGWTASSNFPTLNPYQATHQWDWGDAFVTKLNSAQPPNLVVTQITNPAEATATDSIAVMWSVSNIGTEDAGNEWVDNIYRDTDSLSGGEILLATVTHSGGLLMGAVYTDSTTIVLPEGSEGNWWISVVTGASGNRLVSAQQLRINPFTEPDIDSGLVAWWSFDDSTAVDNSGNGHNGTIYGATPVSGVGALGTALSFDGVNDYIAVPNSPGLNPPNAITVAAWFRPVSYYGHAHDPIVGKAYGSHTNPYYQYHLSVNSDLRPSAYPNSFDFSVAPDGQYLGVGTPRLFWTLGTWYFLAGTYDGSAVKFYVDSTLISQQPANGIMTDYGGPVYIAKFVNLDGYLPGTIDDIRIYNRALSLSEIQHLHGLAYPDVLPDLVVKQLTAPSTATAGFAFKLDWQVENIGGLLAAGGWTDRVYLSTDSLSGNDLLIFSRDNAVDLDSGESYLASSVIPIPENTDGTFWIVVQADATNSIDESGSPQNNFRISDNRLVVKPYPFPDLRVDSIKTAPSAFAGREMQLDWLVKNHGIGGSNSAAWRDRVYLSPLPDFDVFAATILATFDNSAYLDSNEGYITTKSVMLPRDRVGAHYIFVETDVDNRVREKLENNNMTRSRAINLQIPPLPDMQLDSLFGPTSAIPGENITLNWVDRNTGNGDATSTWVDAFYLSLDTQLDQSDVFLGTRGYTVSLPGGQPDDFPHELPAGGFYRGSVELRLPRTLYGVYHIVGVTDFQDAIFEFTGESNNKTIGNQIDLTLVGPPDLIVTEVTSDASAQSGKKLNVSWTVKNDGIGSTGADIAAWSDRVYLSPTPILNPVDTATHVLGTFVSGVGRLTPTADYAKNKEVAIPNGLQGTFYLFVTADVYNNEWENGVDTNNTTSRMGPVEVFLSPSPDLQVISVNTVDGATAGEAIQVIWIVKNLGAADFDSVNISDRIFISPSPVYDTSVAEWLASASSRVRLPIGSACSDTATISVPTSLNGTFYILVQTDVANAVYEHVNENNNFGSSSPIVVGEYPYCDLAVTSATAPAFSLSGEQIDLQWVVSNFSGEATLGTNWSDAVFLSSNSTAGDADDIRLEDVSRSGKLIKSGSYSRNTKVRLPQGIAGQKYIFIHTDAYNAIRETSDDNNVSTILPITIELAPASDLATSGLTIEGDFIAGQRVTVHWQVNNIGIGNAQQQLWYDAAYLSPDEVLSPSDLKLGVLAQAGGLLAGANYQDSLVIELPNYLSGPCYLLVNADNGDVVYESGSESNNIASQSVLVTLAPVSDLIATDVTIPSQAEPGDEVTISWTLHNIGPNPAKGWLRDAVFVSADSVWELSDPALGIKETYIDLAPGAAKQFSAKVSLAATYLLDAEGEITEKLPGVTPGDYHIIVRTDIRNNIRESNESNNASRSTNLMAVDIPSLTLGVPYNTTLGPNQSRFFKVEVDSGLDLSVELNSDQSEADNEMYVSFNRVPTPADHDQRFSEPFQANQEVMVPSTQAGSYYINVLSKDGSGATQGVTLIATALPFSITTITPDHGGRGGNVTCQILGAGFRKEMRIFLVKDTTFVSEGEVLDISSSFEATVRWALADVDLGKYSLVIANDSITTAILHGAYTVEKMIVPDLEAFISGPDEIRQGVEGIYELTIKSNANIDLPYVVLSAVLPEGVVVSTESDRLLSNSERNALLPGCFERDTLYVLNDFWRTGTFQVGELVARDVKPGEHLMCRFFVENESLPGHSLWSMTVRCFVLNKRAFITSKLLYCERLRNEILSASSSQPIWVSETASDSTEFARAMLRGLVANTLIDERDFIDFSEVSPAPFKTVVQCDSLVHSNNLNERNRNFDPNEQCERVPLYALCGAGAAVGATPCLFCAAGLIAAVAPPISAILAPAWVPACLTCGAALFPCALEYAGVIGYDPTDNEYCFSTNPAATLECLGEKLVVDFCKWVIASGDPNDITGPVGFGDEHWIRVINPLPYTIRFENDSLMATAPAQEIRVTQKLDHDLDFKSFRLGSFSFAGLDFDVPSNTAVYSKRLDVRDKLGVFVDFTAGVDPSSGEAFWYFRSIDPQTGTTPNDPLAGLLLVNNANGDGQGFVSYTIKPKTSVQGGDTVHAEATIVFDTNEPIATPSIFNTIDPAAPTSAVVALPVFTTTKQFSIHWDGTDPLPGCGVRDYSLYLAENDGPFELLASGLTEKSFMYEGQFGKKYSFYTIAYDNVGNVEAAPLVADATTTLASDLCGDYDGSGDITIAEVVYLVNYIFMHGPAPIDTRGGDVDCDNHVNIADAVYLINYIFRDGPAPCEACK